MEMPPEEQKLRTASFAKHATRGLIRDPRARRKAMAALLIVAVLMVVAGSTVLRETFAPREHTLRFLLFWAACAWVTVTALLLALFDMLILRAQSRAARRQLRGEIAHGTEADAERDSDAPE